MSAKQNLDLDTVVKFCRRKGFVFPGSEIYGGLANTWDYGPMGVLLKQNLRQAWREHFVLARTDMVELDAGILMNPKVWKASGHLDGFSDCLVDDKKSKHRFRADHLIEDQLNIDVEGKPPEEITKIIQDNKLINPITKEAGDWTEARYMNLMFETNRDKINQDPAHTIYLRPETAQGIFVQFKNILQTQRRKIPFGIGQIGKAFRNEITPGNFVFRVIEMEQMEIEYFIKPTDNWSDLFDMWLDYQTEFLTKKLEFSKDSFEYYQHPEDKLSHYSKKTIDIMYKFPFGTKELSGLAYRTDFDLKQHQEHSGENLTYLDPETNQKYIPHCLEPTIGLDRLFLASVCEFYTEEKIQGTKGEETRTVLKLPKHIAPYKLSILPLMKKDGLKEKAEEIYTQLRQKGVSCNYDEAGSIGKRYRREDENGTPNCLTIDYQTLKDNTVTVRNRDSMEQTRIDIQKIEDLL